MKINIDNTIFDELDTFDKICGAIFTDNDGALVVLTRVSTSTLQFITINDYNQFNRYTAITFKDNNIEPIIKFIKQNNFRPVPKGTKIIITAD